MAKMINVDELIEFCNTERSMLHARGNSVTCAALRRVVEFAKEYAVEVEPVKHGRWIEKEAYEEDRQMGFNFQIVCSNCDEQNSVLYSFDENSEPTEKYFMRTPWCPWCGAKMDLKEGDE